jgi:hypothetical protein
MLLVINSLDFILTPFVILFHSSIKQSEATLKILSEERRVSLVDVFSLLSIWMVAFVFVLLATSGNSKFDSLLFSPSYDVFGMDLDSNENPKKKVPFLRKWIHIYCGSWGYWVVTTSQIPLLLAITVLLAYRIKKRYLEKLTIDYIFRVCTFFLLFSFVFE